MHYNGEIAKSHPVKQPATEPSCKEVLLIGLVACIVFLGTVALFGNFSALISNFGDNSAYLSVASAIRRWDFQGLAIKQFWGFPYLIAVLSTITRISERNSLLLICFSAYFVTAILADRLWNGWISAYFSVINFDWFQRCFIGGSEPLFMVLLFGSFLAARRERWILAALLASFATVVRPVGLFALLGIGLVLICRQQYRALAGTVSCGLIIGGLYVIPFLLYFAAPFVNVSRYQQADWEGGRVIAWPFYALVKGTILYPVPATNLLLTLGWVFFVLAGIIVMFTHKKWREYLRAQPVELVFLITYVAFLYTYNSPYWARGSFPRFAIPVLPIVLLAFRQWLPENRRILWGLGLIMPILAASSALGIRNVFNIIHKALI